MDIERVFTYHAPDQLQLVCIERVRQAAKDLAWAIESNVPEGADRSAALRLVREASMTANAGIVLDGKL